jgi:hypothetical protein
MEIGTKYPLTGPKSPINHQQDTTEQHHACLLRCKCQNKCQSALVACFSPSSVDFGFLVTEPAGDLLQLGRPTKHPQRPAAAAIQLARVAVVHAAALDEPPGPCGASQGPQLRQNPPSTSRAHDPSFQLRCPPTHPQRRRRRSNKRHRADPCPGRACCTLGRAARTLWRLPGTATSPKPVVTQLSTGPLLRAPLSPHAPPATPPPCK